MNRDKVLRENPPMAAALIESLRDIGYSFRSALADIVDNCIAAGASQIALRVIWNGGEPEIRIVDDGVGMSMDELFQAMKPGSRSPAEARAATDLGRFGLGLKTASFSQCRRLTVLSKNDDDLCGYRWDLDVVAEKDAWLLEEIDISEVTSLHEFESNGTVVIWQQLDRLVDTTVQDPASRFNDEVAQARRHLELVFHRFIQGEPGSKTVEISLNNDQLIGFDPFNSKSRATQRLPDERIDIGENSVLIQPFILPHHSKISRSDFDKYAGDEGYTRNQGFYVYRNRRLIDYGTWFRLAPMSDVNRLARVQIDISNGCDHLWQVDVKKSRVSPPAIIRQELKRIIDKITGRSHRVYKSRGSERRQYGRIHLWERHSSNRGINYRINRSHPVIDNTFCEFGNRSGEVETILKLIESNLPFNQIFADMSSVPKEVDFQLEENELADIAARLFETFKQQGHSEEEIRKILLSIEPFSAYPLIVAAL